MLRYSRLLDTKVDWTQQEVSDGKKYLKWEELSLNFEKIDLKWEEIFITLENKGGGGGTGRPSKEYPLKEWIDNNPWNQFKNQEKNQEKKVVRIQCRVGDEDFEEILENKKILITMNDFERVVENIKVKINI